MEGLAYLFAPIFSHRGMLSGSFVRDCVIREEEPNKERDIDVLVPFSKVKNLVKDLEKIGGEVEEIDYNQEDTIAHYIVTIDGWELDIFSASLDFHEYACPPDADVNTLTWDYYGLMSWYNFSSELNGHDTDIDSIVARCLKKEAILVDDEWDDKEELEQRAKKLTDKGWKLLR